MNNTFKERYKKLNKAQKEAVDCLEGPLLVVAGPGSGKTEILSLRIANILLKTDTAPNNILCLTFTDFAAINMRQRLIEIIGAEAYKISIHTFHSFGVEIIDRNPEFFYNGANFIPADTLTQLKIIESILVDTDYDNPLRSIHPEQGFVYSQTILPAIGNLKKAGLTPEEFQAILLHNTEEIEFANPFLAEIFDERINKKSCEKIARLIDKLETHKSAPFPVQHLSHWLPSVIHSLKKALSDVEEISKTTPLSQWKTKNTKKDDNGLRVHKDYMNLEKLRALGDIYGNYKKQMHNSGYYDFSDMLLEAIQALEKNNSLRYNLQEQFQHILVDEFQDTNDAQIRFLRLITDAEVHEGRPNIMVVGDDDQAIYKFQGAEISNILNFQKANKDPQIITMTQNYRSTQDILDVARHIIKKGEERLENIIPELKKELTASNLDIGAGNIEHKIFPTNTCELSFVAEEIKRLIDEGKEPNEIAVISRTHSKLQEMVGYLNSQNITANYERKQNILEESHIHQLITIGRFVATLARKNIIDADEYLPEILSYPFWGLNRATIWNIAVEAERTGYPRKQWLGIMRKSSDRKVSQIADFFDELSGLAQTETLEAVFDAIVGGHQSLMVADSEDEDIEVEFSKEMTPSENPKNTVQKTHYVSPFRNYYFSYDQFKENTAKYLTFLSNLRVFMHALREYKNGEKLALDDMSEFVDLHQKNKLQMTDKNLFTNIPGAVNLLTAHKAKGLEFDTVFVIACQNGIWSAVSRGAKLQFPENLAIAPAGDNFDDHLKLFYVALTRAKRNLYLTSYNQTEEGKKCLELQFLNTGPEEETTQQPRDKFVQSVLTGEECKPAHTPVNILTEKTALSWASYYLPSLAENETVLLKALLENYKMSVTHLNNFLNVTSGGPQTFLEQNLLRFPQSMSPAGAYGTAMHKAIELLYTSFRKDGFIPKLEQILIWFTKELFMKRLSDKDYQLYLKKGKNALTIYYNTQLDNFDISHLIEVNFKNQGVVLGEAHLAGKIDKMIDTQSNSFEVIDFKTGKASIKWEGKTPYEKIKLHNYKRQLIFYKLLIENSRDFTKKGIVKKGRLEFLEPLSGKIITLELEIDNQEVERTKKLIEIVYKKIMNLDFPDISKYPKELKGITEFEDDLLSLGGKEQ
ncbi:ATP-dependent helicase [Patescibacteria group bacterium]|nr:ATP-dependent helicase [Patescibacteria group bacterium]MBU1730251.1 ATP-dependent helicase [Patescibacteria group bacterium]MBU1956086.1 ATP-dependent helicase [Patescibacteria group bacterium]